MNFLFKKRGTLRKIAAILQVLGMLLLYFFATGNAYALKCINANDGTVRFDDNIGSVAVPSGTPDGTVVWRSANRTMTVQCWKDYPGSAENVYFYFNPAGQASTPGLNIGINQSVYWFQ